MNNDKIAIGGALRPLHFGFAALAEWCEIAGLGLGDLNKIGENMSLNHAIALVYCGLKHGARKNKTSFDYTRNDIADWIDTEGIEVFTEVMETFTKSMAVMDPNKKKIKEVQKK